ncbi:MAG: DUF1015 domain-containing protein [Phycisphaerales bacterium]|jgi:uncharacterized protein (DUF1015 family)|nr:DUF1015 domain-containing protein [Phycisphaerales bacterium]
MEIRAFKGWRFTPEGSDDISNYIAPPYDVLTADDKQALLDNCENNVVGVDLPYVPPKRVGPDEVYAAAAARIKEWQKSGLLSQDDAPCIYVYEQTYSWAGTSYTRRAMLCGVRATELGVDVIPHEHTFAGPKADRLKLTKYTNLQLSPIFGFYNDPQQQITKILETAAAEVPQATGAMDSVEQKLWRISDPQAIESIVKILDNEPAYIADGHHRYSTAAKYAKALREAGTIDEDHEANFVMFALVAGDDPGLLVLPTHRVVKKLTEEFSLDVLRDVLDMFEWTKYEGDKPDLSDADGFLKPYGDGAMALIGPDGADVWIIRLASREAMTDAAADECQAWRDLDVAILHTLVLNAVKPWCKTEELTVEYTPDGDKALAACKSGKASLAIVMQGTPLQAVIDIADAGASMPHKSTYFYPKLATGVVFKPL